MKYAAIILLCSLAFVCGAPKRDERGIDLGGLPGGVLNCNLVTCFVDPCMYTKCSADTRCTSCNCKSECKPLSETGVVG
ncbi:hypothetical protein V1264_003356 [Littorina saxatilis]|uniref:Uncharacterized protein n=1 Tax=Littorina saxatilis TaxID=31220 RepID=A0AAN9B596_9CAEN